MENKRKFHRINIILFVCAMLCLITYDVFGGLWLKGITSVWFVILGITNLIYAKKMNCKDLKFVLFILLGLLLGMCADVLLGCIFILGILSFALGHIMYLLAFYSLEKFEWKHLFVILPIAILSLYIVSGTPYIQIEDPFLKKLLLGYALIIACMLSKAITNLQKEKSTYRKIILLGSIMFYFSDIVLAIDLFGESSRLTWILCSYVYWPAQNILAYSLYHFVNHGIEKENKNDKRK